MTPVVVVDKNGLPVVAVDANGAPAIVAGNGYGLPVTLVEAGGTPMVISGLGPVGPAWAQGFDDWADFDAGLSSPGFAGLLTGGYIDLPQSILEGVSVYLTCDTINQLDEGIKHHVNFNDGSALKNYIIGFDGDSLLYFWRADSGFPETIASDFVGGGPYFAQIASSISPSFRKHRVKTPGFDTSVNIGNDWFRFTINKLKLGGAGYSAGFNSGQTNHRFGVKYGQGSQIIFDAIGALFT